MERREATNYRGSGSSKRKNRRERAKENAMKKFFLPLFLPQILFTAFVLLLMIIIPILALTIQPFTFPVKVVGDWYTNSLWFAIAPLETFMLAFLCIAIFGSWNKKGTK